MAERRGRRGNGHSYSGHYRRVPGVMQSEEIYSKACGALAALVFILADADKPVVAPPPVAIAADMAVRAAAREASVGAACGSVNLHGGVSSQAAMDPTGDQADVGGPLPLVGMGTLSLSREETADSAVRTPTSPPMLIVPVCPPAASDLPVATPT